MTDARQNNYSQKSRRIHLETPNSKSVLHEVTGLQQLFKQTLETFCSTKYCCTVLISCRTQTIHCYWKQFHVTCNRNSQKPSIFGYLLLLNYVLNLNLVFNRIIIELKFTRAFSNMYLPANNLFSRFLVSNNLAHIHCSENQGVRESWKSSKQRNLTTLA